MSSPIGAFSIESYESHWLIRTPSGDWISVPCFLDSGNRAGDLINVNSLLDGGFTEEHIDFTTAVTFETVGRTLVSALGTIWIPFIRNFGDVVENHRFYICHFPEDLQEYAVIFAVKRTTAPARGRGSELDLAAAPPAVLVSGRIKGSIRRTPEDAEKLKRSVAKLREERKKEKETESKDRGGESVQAESGAGSSVGRKV